MPELSLAELVLRVSLAAVLGGAIGAERELRERGAGLRTHLLVCVGSALFTLVSAYGFTDFQFSTPKGIVFDPTRIAAQIVTGIGFLGGGSLREADLVDPAGGEVEERVELTARERRRLGGRLHLDQSPVAGHDDVHVRLGPRVLRVVEVEERDTVDDPDGDCGDRLRQRAGEAEAVERAPRGHVCARDRGAAGAAVRLEDVAIQPHRPLAERLEVDHGARRTADQPLDLDRTPALLAAGSLPLAAVAGRRRQHRVLGRQPAAALAVEPAWDPVLDRGGAEDDRAPLRPEHRAVRLLEEVRLEVERAQLVRPAPVRAGHARAPA